jgi:uncharacterized membrane protein
LIYVKGVRSKARGTINVVDRDAMQEEYLIELGEAVVAVRDARQHQAVA